MDYSVRIDLHECPISFLGDGSAVELVESLERAKRMNKEFGLPLMNTPMRQWPGRLVEALEILHVCSVEEHNSRIMAESRRISES